MIAGQGPAQVATCQVSNLIRRRLCPWTVSSETRTIDKEGLTIFNLRIASLMRLFNSTMHASATEYPGLEWFWRRETYRITRLNCAHIPLTGTAHRRSSTTLSRMASPTVDTLPTGKNHSALSM